MSEDRTLTEEQWRMVREQLGVQGIHHPACPGTFRHRVSVLRMEGKVNGDALYGGECSRCGPLGLGLYDTAHTAWLNTQGHEHDEPCPGGKCIA